MPQQGIWDGSWTDPEWQTKGRLRSQKWRGCLFFLKNSTFPCVLRVKSGYFTSRSRLLLSLAYRCDVVQGKWAGALLNSCIFNGIITYILSTESAFLSLNWNLHWSAEVGRKKSCSKLKFGETYVKRRKMRTSCFWRCFSTFKWKLPGATPTQRRLHRGEF